MGFGLDLGLGLGLGASPFLMDVPDLLEVPEGPDGDPDVWQHLHSTGFCLRFGLEGWTW